MSGPPGLIAAALLVARKDLAIELRTRTAFFSALVFALLAVTIFYFAWDATAVPSGDLAPGVVWVIFTFAGLLGLHRSFGIEHADGAIDALLGAPIDREAIFLGKAVANYVFVVAVQLVAIPAVVLLYNLDAAATIPTLVALALVAAVGLVAVGTLFGAMTANTRLAELLLPMLALPFFVPIVLPAAQATARLLAGRPASEAVGWIKLLLAYDLVFVVACAAAYAVIADE